MKLHESTKCTIAKGKNGENLPYLKITELLLVHCNFVNNDYQQHSRILYAFVSRKNHYVFY